MDRGGRRSFAGVVAKMVVVVVGWFEVVCLKQKIEQKNGYLKASQPDESHEFPLNNGGELSAHKLTGITDLRTFLVLCRFPQP